jgi:hypothetical protein
LRFFAAIAAPTARRAALRDAPATREVHVQVEQVHVPALARTETGPAAEYLGGHPLQVDTLRDGDVVRAVRCRHRVVVAQVLTDARARGLVTRREVEFARDRPGEMSNAGCFPSRYSSCSRSS